MAVTATRTTTIVYSGDVVGTQTLSAASNIASPGAMTCEDLGSGFTAVAIPTGFTPVSVTIVPPAGNTTSITLKGVTGDTGIRLHDTDPTTIAIHSSVASIGLTCGAGISNVRFYWT